MKNDASATNSCPTGKLAYLDRPAAKKAAAEVRRHRGDHMRPYRCARCGFWHNGHLPTRVLLGEISSSDHYRQRGEA